MEQTWGLFSKLEGYKGTFPRSISEVGAAIRSRAAMLFPTTTSPDIIQSGMRPCVPSLFLCLLIAATILTSSEAILEQRVSAAGVCLFLLAVTAVPLIYRNALRARGGDRHSTGNAVRLTALIALGGLLSVCAYIRVHRLLDGAVAPADRREWVASVDGVKMKRRYQEAVVSFGDAGGPGSGSGSARYRYRGLLRVKGDIRLGAGDVIRFSGTPRVVAASTAHGRSLLLRGIRHMLYVDGHTIAPIGRGTSFRQRLRERLAVNCDRLFREDTSSVVKALYFGNQDYVDKTTLHDFKRAGALHVLAASGVHVGIVAAVPIFLLGLVRINRKLILAAAGLLIIGYLYITDLPVSLFRACAMFSLYAIQRLFDLKANLFNALFQAAAAIMLLFPGDLFGLAFQLSFGATLGIVLLHRRYLKAIPRLPVILAGPFTLTLAAQTVVMPVLLYRMNELNLAGFFTNIAMVPLVSLLMVASLAANFLSLVASAASWIGVAADHVYAVIRSLAGFASGLDLHLGGEAAARGLPVALFLILAPLIQRTSLLSKAVLLATGVMITAWFFLFSVDPQPAVTTFSHETGTLLMVRDGRTLSIIGRAPGMRHMARVAHEAASASCRDVVLHIPHADYENIIGYAYLVSRLPVRRCYLSEGFRIRGYTRRFFDLLEHDRVDLVIARFGHGAPVEGADPIVAHAMSAYRLHGSASSAVELIKGPIGNVNEGIRHVTLQ